jgi:endonuclease/exonuclease/phosphatase family metal-dependent hydrolase
MTRNLYLGTELGPIFSAPTLPGLFSAVGAGYANVDATEFSARATSIAAEIESTRPDLVGLQEAAIYRTDVPPDGPASPATTVTYDFLQSLLAALEARGLSYEVAAVHVGTDAELPSGFPPMRDVRLTITDAILVRSGKHPRIHIEQVVSGTYAAKLVVPTVAGPVAVPRGWTLVDVRVKGKRFRFVNTHLEAFSPTIQVAQAAELAAGPAATEGPVIVVGDLNSRADGHGTPSYANLIDAGFADAWNGDGGLTCCHAPNLLNATKAFDKRIDFVLMRGRVRSLHADVVGDEPWNRTASGLWPSDHAGVVATLHVKNSD